MTRLIVAFHGSYTEVSKKLVPVDTVTLGTRQGTVSGIWGLRNFRQLIFQCILKFQITFNFCFVSTDFSMPLSRLAQTSDIKDTLKTIFL